MEQATRRSRFTAQPTGRPHRVTPLNLEVLRLLQRYRYLPSTYIPALLRWTGENYKDILTKLRHEAGLIDCPQASWQAANARYRPAVYALTRKGERFLEERGFGTVQPKTGNEFYHELMVCLIQASFEIGAEKHGLELISAQDIVDHPNCPSATRHDASPWSVPVTFAYDGRKVEQCVESDGSFFGLARPTSRGRVALMFPGFEADRRTEPLEPHDYERASIKRKLTAYREIIRQRIYQTRYGLPNAIIAFITVNEAHKRAMMRVLERITEGKGSKAFIFQTLPNFASFENFPSPTGHLLTEDWERVGHPPFNILHELKAAE